MSCFLVRLKTSLSADLRLLYTCSSISSGVNALCAVSYVDIIAIIKPDIPDRTGAKIIVALGKPTGRSSTTAAPKRASSYH